MRRGMKAIHPLRVFLSGHCPLKIARLFHLASFFGRQLLTSTQLGRQKLTGDTGDWRRLFPWRSLPNKLLDSGTARGTSGPRKQTLSTYCTYCLGTNDHRGGKQMLIPLNVTQLVTFGTSCQNIILVETYTSRARQFCAFVQLAFALPFCVCFLSCQTQLSESYPHNPTWS